MSYLPVQCNGFAHSKPDAPHLRSPAGSLGPSDLPSAPIASHLLASSQFSVSISHRKHGSAPLPALAVIDSTGILLLHLSQSGGRDPGELDHTSLDKA